MALAGVVALLAMLGVASGFWSVAHHLLDHSQLATSPQAADKVHDCADGVHPAAPATPEPGPAERPLGHDCPVCDLIASSQNLALEQAEAGVRFGLSTKPSLSVWHSQHVLEADLSAWSARPPPAVG